jgi:protein-S-isoprenylcysteine O-methyltransferase Ste14
MVRFHRRFVPDEEESMSSELGDVSKTGSEAPHGAGVIAPPPLIYLVALGLGFALQAVLPAPDISPAVSWPLGGALVVGGSGLARAFFRALKRAETPISPYAPTTALVTTGAYAITRNPGYLGMTLASSGIAILAGALWPLATLLPALVVIDRGVIAREERHLQSRFGDDYLAYTRRVRRWV